MSEKVLGFKENHAFMLAEYVESSGKECYNINIERDRLVSVVSVEEHEKKVEKSFKQGYDEGFEAGQVSKEIKRKTKEYVENIVQDVNGKFVSIEEYNRLLEQTRKILYKELTKDRIEIEWLEKLCKKKQKEQKENKIVYYSFFNDSNFVLEHPKLKQDNKVIHLDDLLSAVRLQAKQKKEVRLELEKNHCLKTRQKVFSLQSLDEYIYPPHKIGEVVIFIEKQALDITKKLSLIARTPFQKLAERKLKSIEKINQEVKCRHSFHE